MPIAQGLSTLATNQSRSSRQAEPARRRQPRERLRCPLSTRQRLSPRLTQDLALVQRSRLLSSPIRRRANVASRHHDGCGNGRRLGPHASSTEPRPIERSGNRRLHRPRLAPHAETAATAAPSIADKQIFPHILRHSCACHTLEAAGDIRKVSLWLGHASVQSTEIYLRTDPAGKLEILSDNSPPAITKGVFKEVPDRLLAILQDARSPQ